MPETFTIAIANPILGDAATLNGAEAVDGFPISNLQITQPSEVWRPSDITNAFVTIDLGSQASVNLVAMLYTNLSSAATWRVRGASTSAGAVTAAPDYDTSAITAWAQTDLGDWDFVHAINWFGETPRTLRYWRVDVIDTGNSDGHVQAGRLYIDDAWQPSSNIDLGWSLGWVDQTKRSRATSGAIWPTARTPWRALDFRLDLLDEDDMYDEAFDLDRLRGGSGDVFVMRDPTSSKRLQDQSIYGLLTGLRPIIQPHFSTFAKRYRVEEAL